MRPGLFLLMLLLLLSGCMSPGRPGLGESATLRPGWARLKASSSRAIRGPNVWAPLLGAALLQVNDLDRQISDRAREDTPLFGSTQGALDASEDFRRLGEAAQLSTALLTPAPEAPGEWTATKAKLIGSEWLATELTGNFATRVKDYTHRERPNGEDYLSCPSYDATSAAIRANLTNLNIDYLPVEDSTKTVLSLTSSGIGALASWSRVEAGKHYPSDVLLGWALGNFFGYLATEFIAPDHQQFQVMPQISDDTTGIALILRF